LVFPLSLGDPSKRTEEPRTAEDYASGKEILYFVTDSKNREMPSGFPDVATWITKSTKEE
jgi:hypothetical protein